MANEDSLKPASQILRETLQAQPLDGSSVRTAYVSRENDHFVAMYNGVVVARVKNPMALHMALIDKPTTQRAIFAAIEKIVFNTEIDMHAYQSQEIDMPMDAVLSSKINTFLDKVEGLLPELHDLIEQKPALAGLVNGIREDSSEIRKIVNKD